MLDLLELAEAGEELPKHHLVFTLLFFNMVQFIGKIRVKTGQNTLKIALLIDEVDDGEHLLV